MMGLVHSSVLLLLDLAHHVEVFADAPLPYHLLADDPRDKLCDCECRGLVVDDLAFLFATLLCRELPSEGTVAGGD